MAIIKESTFPAMGPDGEPLVRLLDSLPSGADMEKTAGIHPEILAYKQQLEPEPGKTYVHILALGAGDYYGANLNNDHFPWAGLQHDHTKTAHPYMHGYKTFLNAHAFAHHMNKDPEKAYGDVLVSVLNTKMKRVELIVAIDEEKCVRNGGQRTLDKIRAGEYPSTSMGCRVPFDVCSICGHKAKFRSEYCDHMRNNAGKIMADGRKVFVYNPYPRFFDISFVFIGADRTSFVLEKVAHVEQMEKDAFVGKALGFLSKGVTTKAGRSIAGGAAAGGLTGALNAQDGQRDAGFMKGMLGGAVLGGLGSRFIKPATGIGSAAKNIGSVAALGYGGSLAANALMNTDMPQQPAMPAQTSSLNMMPKVAANTMMSKALRKSSGTVQPFMGMRVKRKVARQKTLKVRPITFSKLKSGAKNKAVAQLELAAFDPLPSITFDIVEDKKGNATVGYAQKKVEDKMVEKVSELKSATVTKLSDIFKDVTSTPMGRAVPMSVGVEPDMSCSQMNTLSSSRDLGESLSGLASAGIVLKPKEFQRVVLVRGGMQSMADDLDRRGAVFPESAPVSRSARIVIRSSPSEMIPRGVMDLIGNMLQHRSALTPFALRRPMTQPAPAVRVIRVQLGTNPILDKVASLYNGYREDVLLNTENMIKSAMLTPDIISAVSDARGFEDRHGPAFESMLQVPLAYFSHAYWNRCCCDRTLSDRQFAEKFTEDNPEIARYIAQHVATSCTMQ
jgi:hypothetical protein